MYFLLQKNFPKLLAEINDPPKKLYYRGNLKLLETIGVSIVGTRKNTDYGKKITEELVQICCKNNITIISGLAYGIDSIAHKATLENNGNTIAVLAGGLNEQNIYPRAHQVLANNIINNNGLLVSEYSQNTECYKHHFIARNRIIAGLSKLTIVIEAPKKSGALITAYYALDYNRDVAAIPHSLYTKNSEGCNSLIKKGAYVITQPQDILDILEIPQKKQASFLYNTKNPNEKKILTYLTKAITNLDILQQKCNLSTRILNSTLLELELKGIIIKHNQSSYSLKA